MIARPRTRLYSTRATGATRLSVASCTISRSIRSTVFVSGLLAAKPAESLIFTVVAGVPPGLGGGLHPDYDAILSAPAMAFRPNVSFTGLEPTCVAAGGSDATPPRRLMELGQQLEERGVNTAVASICASGGYGVIGASIVEAVNERNQGRCLVR